jgi:hypothetical protein
LTLASVLLGTLKPGPAAALPVFARIYDEPCGACHTVFPQLNPAGENFRAHGLHGIRPRIEPLKVGSLFEVPGTLPLALYLSAGEDLGNVDVPGPSNATRTRFNLQFLRLLAGGELGQHLSFLFDWELAETELETGDVRTDTDPYTAYLMAHAERWGWLWNAKGGWYELPLTVSPLVHRLSVRPYLTYELRACSLFGRDPPNRACEDTTIPGEPQVGLDLSARQRDGGLDLAAGFTNGSNARLDDTASQDAYLHVSQAFGLHRLGFFLFYSPDVIGDGVHDQALRLGPNVDIYNRRFRLLGQFLAAYESNPTGQRKSLWYYGTFLEANYRLTTTLASLLRVEYAWAPRFNDRRRGGKTRAEPRLWEVTGGWQWLILENLKAVAEVTYAENHDAGSNRSVNAWSATLRLVTAFWPLTPPGMTELQEWTEGERTP